MTKQIFSLGLVFVFLFPFCTVERRVAAEVARLQLRQTPVVFVTRDTVVWRDTVWATLPETEQTNEVLAGWFALPEIADTVLHGDNVRLEIRRDTVIRFRTVVKERGIAVPVVDTIYLTKERQTPSGETHADKFAWLYALAAGIIGLILFFTQKRRENGN